jgi:hypothetical protein
VSDQRHCTGGRSSPKATQGENANTYRMRVPGGWLYRYQPNITSPPSSMAFVPDPVSRD